MPVLVLSERDVHDLLPMRDCIEVMQRLFAGLAGGVSVQPPRIVAWRPDRLGAMAAMPGWLANPPALGAKLISVFPQNRSRGMESHQGIVALHDPDDGRLIALIHAGAVTAIRTAAVSGLATRLLAAPQASQLAILGSGTQACMHLEAMLAVRPVRSVRVWSRTPKHARAFADAMQEHYPIDIAVASMARAAVESADLICTVTASSSPVLEGAWLRDGVHVNAAGASVPGFRELDAEAVRRARLFAEHRENVLRECDDVRLAIAEGIVTEQHILGELSGLAAGTAAGRTAPDQVTLFESTGMALEDLAAAHELYERAIAQSRGTPIAF